MWQGFVRKRLLSVSRYHPEMLLQDQCSVLLRAHVMQISKLMYSFAN